MKLSFAESYVIPRQRLNDDYLMDTAIDQSDLKEKEILYINILQLYFQVLTIADITIPLGDCLIEDAQKYYANQVSTIIYNLNKKIHPKKL